MYTYINLHKSVRKLNIKMFFELKKNYVKKYKQNDTEYQHSNLRNTSIFKPKNKGNLFLKVFTTMVEIDIRKINTKQGKRYLDHI